jgi:hypothetical protein
MKTPRHPTMLDVIIPVSTSPALLASERFYPGKEEKK